MNYCSDSIRTGHCWRITARISIHPEWPHKQGGCLACCGYTFESRWGCTDLYYARGAQGVLPIRVGGKTTQLDLPSLTPLSVAGCSWLQLGVPHWAASVHYCKQLVIDSKICGSRFSTLRLLAIEDLLLLFSNPSSCDNFFKENSAASYIFIIYDLGDVFFRCQAGAEDEAELEEHIHKLRCRRGSLEDWLSDVTRAVSNGDQHTDFLSQLQVLEP